MSLSHTHKILALIDPPKPQDLPDTIEAFLRQLGGPTAFLIQGEDTKRTRAIVTLLHGNEPSGTSAIFRWLKEGTRPAVNILVIIASVKVALTEPYFSHRFLPHQKDLNRCFWCEPFDEMTQLAHEIYSLIYAASPEALVDIHNTSGVSPSFAITTEDSWQCHEIAKHFTQRIVITGLFMGALMECSGQAFPAVTIECGGAQDIRSDEVAYEGLMRYVQVEDLFVEKTQTLEYFRDPVRVELSYDATLAYGNNINENADITLIDTIERHNFGVIHPDALLGFVQDEQLSALCVRDSQNKDVKHDYFYVTDKRLFPARPLKLFMLTHNQTVAAGDCLFYAVQA